MKSSLKFKKKNPTPHQSPTSGVKTTSRSYTNNSCNNFQWLEFNKYIYGELNGTFGYAALYLGETSLNRNLGGGGYYGGGSSIDIGAGAGGGSSFISGYFGCDAIAENSTKGKIYHTGQSIHYSNITFVNTVIKNGNETFIKPNREGNEPGHKTTGNVVITVILPRFLCTGNNSIYLIFKKLSINFVFFFSLK